MLKTGFSFFLISLFSFVLLIGCAKKEAREEIKSNDITELNEKKNPTNYTGAISGVRSIKVNNIGSLNQVFNDSNYLQLQSAKNLGIDPISNLNSAYFIKRPIIKIESNDFYQLDTLKHSIPFLVPEAASLLEDIGKNFIDSLEKRGGDSYKIKVTSLLRTPESVGRLRRVNINASDSSTHQYGTTFDISYVNFYCTDKNRQINQGDLKNLLAEVLQDLRKEGRCLVKYEIKTGCFHVTATR